MVYLSALAKKSRMASNKDRLSVLAPIIMFAFFVMGFVDMVGTATNYVKADFGLSDTMANFLPSMVFLWFFFLAVPVSLLMNRIGKRRTVLLSLAVTSVSMALPLISYTYPMLLVSFCLLGLGNAFMQVSLNPVLSCVVPDEEFAGTLTFVPRKLGGSKVRQLDAHLSGFPCLLACSGSLHVLD